MNPYAALDALHVAYSDLEITTFMNVAKSVLFGVRQQFMANCHLRRRNKRCQRSDAI